MGDVKNNLSPKTEKGKSLLDRFKKNKKDDKKVTEGRKAELLKQELAAKNFIDTLAETEKKLDELLAIKEKDLIKEKDKTLENTLKVAKLKTMRFHFNAIMDEVVSYTGDC